MRLTLEAEEEFRLLVTLVQHDWWEACDRAAEREAAWYPETNDKFNLVGVPRQKDHD